MILVFLLNLELVFIAITIDQYGKNNYTSNVYLRLKFYSMELSDILTHLGETREEYFRAIAPPVIQTSNFAFSSVVEMRQAIVSEIDAHVYTRGNNPTVAILREKLAALEATEDSLVTGSGSSAIAGAILPFVKSGDHIVCVQKPYSWTYKLITTFLQDFGIEHDFVDGRDTNNIINAIKRNTKIIYLESPNSLTFELQDIEACTKVARERGILTIIDNSHCSPLYQKPHNLGVDLVVHSATKYLNGHSDVVAGVICGSKQLIHKIFTSSYMTLGLIISPHDAAMILRGLRTLPLRVNRSHETAFRLAQKLENHPKIERVIYPWLTSFPQYELAKKQMSGAGGLLTIILKADQKDAVYRFTDSISRFLLAVSWGGYESLMIPSIVFHDMPGIPDSPVPWNYVRLYVGLEDFEYLWEDLESALSKV